jgi:hypothetical protein
VQRHIGVVISLTATLALFAQGERGTFNGTVTDPSGGAIVAAAVKVLNPATGVEFHTVTTDAGVYRMPSLPSGDLPNHGNVARIQGSGSRERRPVGSPDADGRFHARGRKRHRSGNRLQRPAAH